MSNGNDTHDPYDRPIPTPWRVRWARFRQGALPFLTLGVAVVLTGWLWSRYAGYGHALGEVERMEVIVTAELDGRLAQVPGRRLEELDRVKADEVVAVLDAGPIRSRREAVRLELERLEAELIKAKAAAATPGGAAPAGPGAPDIATLEAAIDTKSTDLAAMDQRLLATEIRSPIAGVVKRIHRRPNQFVRAGEPVMEIAAQGGSYVVGYVRQGQVGSVEPAEGMAVDVRVPGPPAQNLRGTVERVGGELEAVPAHQLRDQRTQEWGLRVRVALPPQSALRPGELVNLVFRPEAE